jgi:phage gp36-like protein
MAYCSQTDLENALGVPVVKAIFDDNLDGTVDAAAMTACVDYATAECNSFLRGQYDITFPIATVPDELKFAAVDFACAYATRRRPDIVRAMGEQPWTTFRDSAIEKMKRFGEAMQRLPPSTGTPENVGAEVRSGDADYPTIETPQRHWLRMGDF